MTKRYDYPDYTYDGIELIVSNCFSNCSYFCDTENDDYILNSKDRERIGSTPVIMSASISITHLYWLAGITGY